MPPLISAPELSQRVRLALVKTLDIPEWIGYVPDSKPFHLIITSASGSCSFRLIKLKISSIKTMQYNLNGDFHFK